MTRPLLRRRARAKLNLYLHLLGRRSDGYHELDSLVAFAELGDELTVEAAETLSLRVTGQFAGALDAEADNLVLRAARRLAAAAGVPAVARLTLDKRLPVAAGLGGGSADAAAALKLLADLWRIRPAMGDLERVAASLGADVPACLAGRPLYFGGIGHALAPLPGFPALGLLLVNPGESLPTAQVFAAFRGPFGKAARFACAALTPKALVGELQQRRNDLQAPAMALCPAIEPVLAALAALPGAMLARMSGSGASCFALFENAAAAATAAAVLRQAQPDLWIAATCLADPDPGHLP